MNERMLTARICQIMHADTFN